MKTSELIGPVLDWAVAKCEGAEELWYDTVATYWMKLKDKDIALAKGWAQSYQPSTDWSQGGPIIEREKICVSCPSTGDFWDARLHKFPPEYTRGLTPLIAAMRTYVASKLGDEVEIPQELLK